MRAARTWGTTPSRLLRLPDAGRAVLVDLECAELVHGPAPGRPEQTPDGDPFAPPDGYYMNLPT